jgi:hypothetical protein
MNDSVEKGLLPDILLKRDNYEEWSSSSKGSEWGTDAGESRCWSGFQRDLVSDAFFEDPTIAGTWNRVKSKIRNISQRKTGSVETRRLTVQRLVARTLAAEVKANPMMTTTLMLTIWGSYAIVGWTDGLERIRDNCGCSSVVGISGGKSPITHIGYLDPIGEVNVAPGAKSSW